MDDALDECYSTPFLIPIVSYFTLFLFPIYVTWGFRIKCGIKSLRDVEPVLFHNDPKSNGVNLGRADCGDKC